MNIRISQLLFLQLGHKFVKFVAHKRKAPYHTRTLWYSHITHGGKQCYWKNAEKSHGLGRESNPGPLSYQVRIIPLDHQATWANLIHLSYLSLASSSFSTIILTWTLVIWSLISSKAPTEQQSPCPTVLLNHSGTPKSLHGWITWLNLTGSLWEGSSE